MWIYYSAAGHAIRVLRAEVYTIASWYFRHSPGSSGTRFGASETGKLRLKIELQNGLCVCGGGSVFPTLEDLLNGIYKERVAADEFDIGDLAFGRDHDLDLYGAGKAKSSCHLGIRSGGIEERFADRGLLGWRSEDGQADGREKQYGDDNFPKRNVLAGHGFSFLTSRFRGLVLKYIHCFPGTISQ
jgi:hypothetical protein